MYKRIALWVVMLLFVSCAGVQLQKGGLTDPGQLLFNGHTNPAVNCYRCHNGDATGSTRGPSLAEAALNMPDEALLTKIEKGSMWMPAYGDKTTPEERQQIVGWLRTAFGGKAGEQVEEVEAVEEPSPATEPKKEEPPVESEAAPAESAPETPPAETKAEPAEAASPAQPAAEKPAPTEAAPDKP